MNWDPLTVLAIASMASAAAMVVLGAMESLRHAAPWRLRPVHR